MRGANTKKVFFLVFVGIIVGCLILSGIASASSIDLYDSKGYTYDIYDGCYMSDGDDDSYDGMYELWIDNNYYSGTRSTTEDGGREAICDVQTLSGLEVSRKVFVPTTEDWARYLEILYNPTGSPITEIVWVGGDLGSDSYTVIVETSDGDTTFETTDRWLVTDDDDDGYYDPSLGHVFDGVGGQVSVDYVEGEDWNDEFWYYWTVTVPPGETVIIMHFAIQHEYNSDAIAEAESINPPEPEVTISGMSDNEKGSVVNWNINQFTAKKFATPKALWGQNITYNISYFNNYKNNITNLTIYDFLSENVTYIQDSSTGTLSGSTLVMGIGNVLNKSGGFCEINATVNNNAPQGKMINNTANISFTDPSSLATNITVQNRTLIPNPTVDISKDSFPCVAPVGDTLNYTIYYSNPGIVTARNVVIKDFLPSGINYLSDDSGGSNSSGVITFILGDLAPGVSGNITITAQVTAAALTRSLNNATVTYENEAGDPFVANEVAYTRIGSFDVVVDKKGSTPYTTIQSGVNAASAGNSIFVCPGTYYETVDINKQVSLTGAGADLSIVDANGAGDYVFDLLADSINLAGFTVTGSGTYGIHVGYYIYYANISYNDIVDNAYGMYLYYSENDAIEHNNITGSNSYGMYLYYAYGNVINNNNISGSNSYNIRLYNADGNTISNNTISHSTWQEGIYSSNSDNNQILDNVITHNDDQGIYLSGSHSNTLINNNIYNNGISSSYDGIYLSSSNSNTLTNNTVSSNGDDGIYIYSSDSNTLTNNTVSSNGDDGIYIYSSDSNTLTDNTLNANSDVGMYLSNSFGNTLSGNIMDGNKYNFQWSGSTTHIDNNIDTSNKVDGKPIYYVRNVADIVYDGSTNAGTFYCFGCINITIKDLNFTKNYYGVYLRNTNFSNVQNISASSNYYGAYTYYSNNNTISESSNSIIKNGRGLYLYYSDGNSIQNNSINNNSNQNIYLYRSDGNTISNNNLSYSLYDEGIYSYYSDNNQILDNVITSNDDYGIYLDRSHNNSLINNYISNTTYYDGIRLYYSNSNTLTNNTASSNGDDGIYIYSSDSNTLTNNTVSSNGDDGIDLDHSDSNTLINNYVTNSTNVGIYLYYSDTNFLTNNTADSNGDDGIYLRYSSQNILTDNVMAGNTYNFGVYGTQDSQYNNSIDTSNAVDGKPVYYIKNAQNTVYDGSTNTGTIYCIWCDNITVMDLTFSKNNKGILFWRTNNSRIESITTVSNFDGIYLGRSSANILNAINASANGDDGVQFYYSYNNTLTDISALSNWDDGIDLDHSDNNTLESNTISSSNDDGLYLGYSEFNTITSNTIISNEDGIYLYYSNSNTIANNNVSNNSVDDGIYFQNSHTNTFSNNTLISNEDGIYFSNSNNNIINNNSVYGNSDLDFHVTNSINSGDNNTCDRPDGWNDEGVIGCRYLSQPLSNYPDFIVTNVTWSPSSFNISQSVIFNATVKNTGPANFNDTLYVGFYIDGEYTASTSIFATLNVGQSLNVSWPWTATKGGANRTLSAKADYNNYRAEYNDTNNEMNVTLPYIPGPDLVVSNTTWSPANPAVGTTVTLYANVTNIGDVATGYHSGEVGFYIDGTYIGYSQQSADITPGKNVTFSRTWTATPGNHTVKAKADYYSDIYEQDESNNELTDNMPYIPGPDLIVEDIYWSPQNPSNNNAVTFTATITNVGDASTTTGFRTMFYVDGSYLEYYGTYYGSIIPPGGSVNVSRTWTAITGNHTIKVWTDWSQYYSSTYRNRISELNESNNDRTETMPHVPGPDLVVTNITWSPVTYSPGDTVTFTATVKNIGEVSTGSYSEYVGFYIDGNYIGNVYAGYVNIAVGQSVTASKTWIGQGGNHTVKVKADYNNYRNELDESNNYNQTDLPYVPPPDLIVTNLTWTPYNHTAGDSITLNATVKNIGTSGWTGTTRVDFYYKNTTSITSTSPTLSIPPGSEVYVTYTWSDVQAGDFYFRAQVDRYDDIDESDNTNNDYYVKSPNSPLPDLIITNLTISPSSPNAGDTVTLNATIKNIGPGNLSSRSFVTSFYVDGSNIGSTSKTYNLPVNGTDYAIITWSATPGSHSVKASVDSNSYLDELNENNNDLTIYPSSIAFPDLVVGDIFWSPDTYSAGQTVTIYATIKNLGPGYSYTGFRTMFYVDGSYLEYYGTYYGNIIPPGESVNVSRTWTAQGGNHTVKVKTDYSNYYNYRYKISEVSEGNNERIEELSSVLYPDIIVTQVTASKDGVAVNVSDINASYGDKLTFNATLENVGLGDLVDANLYASFYIDGNYKAQGHVKQNLSVNGKAYVIATWTATPGSYSTFKAKADSYNYLEESNETNNEFITTFNPIAYPDLVIDALYASPDVFEAGQTVTFTATVRNNGTGTFLYGNFSYYWLRRTYIHFYIDGSSLSICSSYNYANFYPQDSVNISCTWTATPGEHNLLAKVDVSNYIYESNDTNNQLGVALNPSPYPDFIVQNLTWSPATFDAGDTVTLTATVKNVGEGNVSAGYKYARFYIDSTSIGTSSKYTAAKVNETFTISGTWTATPGNHSLKVHIDPSNYISESNEGNNELTTQLPLTSFPDLIVEDISWPSTSGLSIGESLTLTAEVKNNGSGNFSSCYYTRFFVDGSYIGEVKRCGLDSGEAFNGSTSWSAVSGSHSIKAVADYYGHLSESNEVNNDLTEIISLSIPQPDFAVSNIVVLPPNPIDGQTSTITATVSNSGPGSTVGGYLYVRFSVDGVDQGQQTIYNGIAAGSSKDISTSWSATGGNHTVSVIADYGNHFDETNETNNEGTLGLSYPAAIQPDLIVSDVYLTKISLSAGEFVEIYSNITNLGGETRRCLGVSFYVDGKRIGGVQQSVACGINANQTLIAFYPWYATPGTHNIKVVADPSNSYPETNESNNDRTIISPTVPYPDLVITNISYSPTTGVQPGDVVTIYVEVKNNDAGDVITNTRVHTLIGRATLSQYISGGVSSGATRTASLTWIATPGSNFTIDASVDPSNRISESNESNNQFTLTTSLDVPFADLIVENITYSPTTNIRDEDIVVFNITVNNRGAGSATSFRPAVNVGSERLIGSVNSLSNGSTTSVLLNWRAKIGNNFSISGEADYYNNIIETNESNNHFEDGVIPTVLPVEKFSTTVSPSSQTLGLGSSTIYYVEVNNYGSATSNYSINISGIDPSWYSLEKDIVFLGAGEKAYIKLNTTVPFNCSLDMSDKTITATIKSLITNTSKSATAQLSIDPGYTIQELRPFNNARVGSTEAAVTWTTRTNTTSQIFVREEGTPPWTVFNGSAGLLHSIVVTNRTRNVWHEFYVVSNNSCGSGASGIRRFYVDNGISFTQHSLTFNINRDYDQPGTIYIKNTDSTPHNVLVQVTNPYEDLIVGFVGAGSVDAPITTLNPGETKGLSFRMHTQDALLEDYDLVVNLTDFDVNGSGTNITDFAAIHVDVHFPFFNFTLEEIDRDPLTLERTFKITNLGDPVTDISLHVDDSIKDKVIFEPSFDHAYLRSGQSITTVATPLLEVGSSGFEGTLFLSGVGKTINRSVDFLTAPGEVIFEGRYPGTEIIFSPIFDKDESNITNPLNGSVVDSVLINGSLVYIGDVFALVKQVGKPVFDTNVSLTISDGITDSVYYGTTDPLGLASFRISTPPGNYSYNVEAVGLAASTETRYFSVNSTPSTSFTMGIEWLSIEDSNSTYSGTADNIVLDSAPYVIKANATNPPLNATALLILSWDILPSQKMTVQGTLNGSLISFETSAISPANYSAIIALITESSILVSQPKNISFTDYSLKNFEEYTLIRHFNLNDSDDNVTAQTIVAKKVEEDPRKTIVLKDIVLNDEKTEFTYSFVILSNETLNDTLLLNVKDSNETIIFHTETNITLIADTPLEVSVTVPVEYATGDYTIEVITLDPGIVHYIVSNTLEALGVPSKIASVAGSAVNCALAFTPWGAAIGVADLIVNVVKMMMTSDVGNTASTIQSTAGQGLNQLNKVADARKLASGITGAGKFIGGPIFSCITDLIDIIKDLTKDGTTIRRTQRNWRCTNRPVVNDPIDFPDTIPEYLDDGTPNIDRITMETSFGDLWGSGVGPFDTIYEWNGYRFGELNNEVPLGDYQFEWNNPDPYYIHTTGDGTGKNYMTTYTRGLNPGHYAQTYSTTINIFVKQVIVKVAAKNQTDANNRISTLTTKFETKPDAAIPLRDLKINNTSPKKGDTIDISTTVHNFGTRDITKIKVYFYDNDELIGQKHAYMISPAGSETVSMLYKIPSSGPHQIKAVADPLTEISEEDETNNVATQTIEIGLPPADLTPTDITFTPSMPTANDTINATVFVENLGNTSLTQPVNVSLEVNSTPQFFWKLVDMAGLVEANITFSFNATMGDHIVTTTVDPQDIITESDDTNNVLSKAFYVGPSDIVPPTISIFSPQNTTYTSSYITINVSSDDSSGIAEVKAEVDGITNLSLGYSGGYYMNSTTLPDGDHWIRIYGRDNVDNLNSSEVVYFTVNTPPVITLISPQNTTYSTLTIDLNVTADEAIDTWIYDLNGAGNQTFTPNTTITAVEGTNNIVIYANDTGGKWNSSAVYFTVDTIPPTITITSPLNNTYQAGDPILLSYDSNEPISADYYVLDGGTNKNFTNGTATITPGLGNHDITIQASDSVGNLGSYTAYFTVEDTIAPIISSPLDRTLIKNSFSSTSWTITEANPDTYKLYWNGTRSTTVIKSGSYQTGTPISVNINTSTSGRLNYTLWANDTLGRSSQDEVQIEIKAARGVSIASQPSSRNVLTDQDANFTVAIRNTGNAGDTYTLTVTSSPGLDTATLTANQLTLNASEVGTVTLTMRDSSQGTYVAAVTAYSTSDTSIRSSTISTTTVTSALIYGVDLSVETTAPEVEQNELAQYTMTVTNTGNQNDTINLALNSFGVNATLDQNPVYLLAGESTTITLNASGYNIGTDFLTQIIATSGNDSTKSKTVDIKTTILDALEIEVEALIRAVIQNENAEFILKVKNTGTKAHNFTLSNTVPSRANASFDQPSILLSKGQEGEINFTINSALVGTHISTLTVTDVNESSIKESVTFTAYVNPAAVYGISLTSDVFTKTVNQNEFATYTITIYNTGNQDDTYNLYVLNPRADTAILNGTSTATIVKGSSDIRTLSVRSSDGGIYGVKVAAISQKDPSKRATIITLTKVRRYGVTLIPDTTSSTVKSGNVTTFTLTVKNTGNTQDSFDLDATNSGTFESASLSSTTVSNLASGSTEEVILTVSNSTSGTGQLTVTAQSQGDTVKNASVTLTVEVTEADIQRYGVDLTLSPAVQEAEINENAIYTVIVKNSGNVEDTIILSAVRGHLYSTVMSLGAGEIGTTTLILNGSAYKAYKTAVKATSSNTSVSDSEIAHLLVKRAVRIEAVPPSQTVYVGNVSTYSIKVKNIGLKTHSYTLTVVSNSSNTTADLSTSSITDIASGDSAILDFTFNSTSAGARMVDATIQASVTGEPDKNSSTDVRTVYVIESVYGVSMTSDVESQAIASGANATFLLTVKNLGNQNDTFTLTKIKDDDSGSLSITSLALNKSGALGDTGLAILTLNPTVLGEYIVTIEANSTLNSMISDMTTLTTRVVGTSGNIITNCEIDDESTILNSNCTTTTIEESFINHSDINNYEIIKSNIINSTVVDAHLFEVTVEDANVTGNVIYYGNITIEGLEYYINTSVALSDIVVGSAEEDSNVGGVSGGETLVDAEETETQIKMGNTQSYVGGSISIKKSYVPPAGAPTSGVGVYLNIEASNNIKDSTDWIIINTSYDPASLPSGTNESTLRIIYYNETSRTWIRLCEEADPNWCFDAGVNTINKYVWANVSHFSIYGMAGSVYGGGGSISTSASAPATTLNALRLIKEPVITLPSQLLPGGSVPMTIILENTGDVIERIVISILDLPLDWTVTGESFVKVMPGEKKTVTLTLKIPPTATGTKTYTLRLTAKNFEKILDKEFTLTIGKAAAPLATTAPPILTTRPPATTLPIKTAPPITTAPPETVEEVTPKTLTPIVKKPTITTKPLAMTAPLVTAQPKEEKKGICGPTAILLLLLISAYGVNVIEKKKSSI